MNRPSLPAKTRAAAPAGAADAVPESGPAAWRAVGTAVAGISHVRLGKPCQDAQAFAVHPSGALLVAVADGAGSAERSDEGAQAAVAAALAAMTASADRALPVEREGQENLLRDAFTAARAAVIGLADDQEAAPRDFACTLTCVAAADRWLAVGQVGDGAVVALDEQEALFAVTRLQRGEYANETHFLIQEDALDQLTVEVVDQAVRGLAVMSDGLIRLALKLPGQEPHAPFFQPLFRFTGQMGDPAEATAQLAAFLDSERVNARTDDDKSLVLAVRAADALEADGK